MTEKAYPGVTAVEARSLARWCHLGLLFLLHESALRLLRFQQPLQIVQLVILHFRFQLLAILALLKLKSIKCLNA